MDTELTPSSYNIHEPWTTDDNDVAHYLYDRGFRFTMRSTSLDVQNKDDGIVIYTVSMDDTEATFLMLSFPGITVSKCKEKEKVSTLAKRILCADTTES